MVDTNFALQMFSSDKKKAVAEFGKFHTEITDSWCLDIDEGKKAPSDKDVRDLALDKYNIDLSKLQNMEQKNSRWNYKIPKKDREISLRQLSRLTGFTIHRIYKVRV